MVGGEGVGMLPADPLVVVVDGDRESALGPVLADYVTIEFRPNFPWFGQSLEKPFARRSFAGLPVKNIGAKGDAVVANVDPRTGDEFLYLRMALSAEGAKGEVGGAGHGGSGLFCGLGQLIKRHDVVD
jgi:hypothetical protein